MLNFWIVVLGSEFSFWFFTVITQGSLLKGLSVSFQDKLGCKEGETIAQLIADFDVPHNFFMCSVV